MRIGHGYDAHRLAENRRLVLGGAEIEYEKGLAGHSDADALTHAVIDALLGAMGRGDIGRLFPDSLAEYKDICSLRLLEKVRCIMDGEGFAAVNLDCTIIAQRPRLAAYTEQMEENLRRILGPGCCVNVKATTEEGMGFTGAGEGIAAHAVCLLENIGEG